MNHDATHCYDYSSKCPKSCYRAQLTEELRHIDYPLPVSWAMFKGTKDCPLTVGITLSDCEEMYRKFIKYTETAEQHEFMMLALVNMKLDLTMEELRACGEVKDQKDARAMFRVVLKTIGEDFQEYEEEE